MDRETLQESTLALQHFYDIGAVKRRTPLGPIFQATELPFDRPVTVWVLDRLKEMGAGTAIIERCETAAYLTSRLKAPANVRTIDSGRIGTDVPFLVLEDFAGRDLRAHLAIHGPLSDWETLRTIEQLGEAVEDAHKQNLVGLGLDADRVIVDNAKRMQVRVFGHGLFLSRRELLDLDDAIVGIDLIRHVSPASFTRDAAPLRIPGADDPTFQDAIDDLDGEPSPEASDIYALAAIAYECLSGMHPYFREGREVGDGVLAILRESPPDLASHFGVEAGLASVVHEALGKTCKFPSIGSFVAALRSALDDEARGLADSAARPDWLGTMPSLPDATSFGRKKIAAGGVRPWIVRGLVAMIVLLAAGLAVASFFAVRVDVTQIAMVPEFAAPAQLGEGVDVVVQTTVLRESLTSGVAEQSPVSMELYRVSTRGDTVPIAQTPFVIRNQEPGTRLRLVVSAEGFRPRQIDLVVREQNDGAMFVTERMEIFDPRTASLMP